MDVGEGPDEPEAGGEESPLEAARRRQAEIAAELPDEVEHPGEAGYGDDGQAPPPSGRIDSWRRRSAVGAVLTGIALGIREVLEPERQEAPVVMETSGVPPRDLPVEADLQEPAPKRNVVAVRPWLLGGPSSPTGSPAGQITTAGQTTTAGRAGPASDRPPTAIPGRSPARRRLGRRRR